MKILLSGQKLFAADVFRSLIAIHGVEIVAVSAPLGGEKIDRLAAQAALRGVPVIKAGLLSASTMPDGIDLIVTAHSHDFIGEKTRLRAKYGGIGYHPSLLPLHRGRDAIRWAIKMRERVTGGTVYRLSNRVDGGAILAQEHVFVRPGDTARDLWHRDLAPVGVRLLCHVVREYVNNGFMPGVEQDETLATWEPSLTQPPIYRPDLMMIEHQRGHIT